MDGTGSADGVVAGGVDGAAAVDEPADGVDNAMVLLRSTYGSEEDAAAAAHRLLERRVAACVHVSPLRSVYRWKGRVEDEPEWLLEARTPVDRRDDAWAALLDGHPYDNPLVEVVAETLVPVRYAQWARRCVS